MVVSTSIRDFEITPLDEAHGPGFPKINSTTLTKVENRCQNGVSVTGFTTARQNIIIQPSRAVTISFENY